MMRMSKLFFASLRQIPADAQVKSHQLMLRANMIKKLASGIYTYLPLGYRVIKKISAIIQSEMDAMGAQEILMPMVQPAELWKESGRFEHYGPELLKFKDRKDTLFCLGPTHEEVVSSLVRDQLQSYKSLPITLYQIQTKFRDEIRPRFGLMRGREFIMKDAYSFCIDKKTQDEIYQLMWQAYNNIFTRCGLDFRAVKADTGTIGGDLSHEFQVLAQSGEDAIASCTHCKMAANVELAFIKPHEQAQCSLNTGTEIHTPEKKTMEEVTEFLKADLKKSVKALAMKADGKIILVLVRGDHTLSETKLKKLLNISDLSLADEAEVKNNIGEPGFLGPFNTKTQINIYIDNSLKNSCDLICGSNKKDFHLTNISLPESFAASFGDFREAVNGDPCIECGHPYEILRGIEVGHIFYLGKKYSNAMNIVVQNEEKENITLEMGCYGIGVGRTMAAAIEQNHDERGIIWPKAIAPYDIHLVLLSQEQEHIQKANIIYEHLQKNGFEVLFDDRDERAGVKLNDADLIGCPIRINLGKKSLSDNKMEIINRSQSASAPVLIDLDMNYVDFLKKV